MKSRTASWVYVTSAIAVGFGVGVGFMAPFANYLLMMLLT